MRVISSTEAFSTFEITLTPTPPSAFFLTHKLARAELLRVKEDRK